MSIQSKVLKYTARGGAISLKEEVDNLPDSPTGSQALIRFLASPVSHTDFKAILSSGTEKNSVVVEPTNVRFVKAQKVEPFGSVVGPIGKLPTLPAVGGIEGVAVVEAVGPAVKGLKPGDWVVPPRSLGSWRTHAQVNEGDLLPISNEIPAEYAANLSVSPLAALRLLEDFVPLKAGDVVYHNAANGLVGQALIQIAVSRGIKVVSIVRSRNRYETISWYLKSLGSTLVLPYEVLRTQKLKEVLADLPPPSVAFDAVGGDAGANMARLLPAGGTLVTYGNLSGAPLVLPTEKNLKVKGLFLSDWVASKPKTEQAAALATLAKLVKDGKLRLLLERANFESYPSALNKGFEDMRDRRLTMVF